MLAVAGVVGLLLFQEEEPRGVSGGGGGGGGGAPPRDGGGGGGVARVPEVAAAVRAQPGRAQEALDEFVARCRALGAAAVPELVARLRGGDDEMLQPRWTVPRQGFPTLRAAYLEALAAIDGDAAAKALRELLPDLTSAGETHLVAAALVARGEAAVVGAPVLARVENEPPIAERAVHEALLALAAEADPAATEARLLETTQRGDSGDDPHLWARALERLPLDAATRTATTLLRDPDVTPRAKTRYLRSLFDRGELAVYEAMQLAVERREFDERLKIELAYAAAGGAGFMDDAHAYQKAKAENDTPAMNEAKQRFDDRLDAATRLTNAALNLDLATSDNPRAASIRRLFERHRQLVYGTG